MARRADVYDPFVRNSSAAGGLSSVSTYKHCAVKVVSGESTGGLLNTAHPRKRPLITVFFPGKLEKTLKMALGWLG